LNKRSSNKDIEKVERYLEDLGIEVHYSAEVSDSFCDLYWYEIHIPQSETEEFILFSLLHEGGHFLVEAHDLFESDVDDDIDIIVNEVLAWEAGLDIAESCELDIDMKRYYNTAKESLEKYIKAYRKKNP
tara:strand:- start:609 stop:998 length:390 start_codon:yes stop_codon:yes gene_type:complete